MYPPKSVGKRIRGVAEVSPPPAPDSPPCATGLPADCVALVSKEAEPVPRRDVEFEIGRRRFGTQYSAALRDLFEVSAPIERVSGPAYRLLSRERAGALRTVSSAENGSGPTRLASEAALQVIPLPASAEAAGSLLRAWPRCRTPWFAPWMYVRSRRAKRARRSLNRYVSCRV